MFKRILSYFFPVNIYKRNSSLSKSIEITWNNGQLVLDSQNTNYSYGSLQRILRKGLKTIGFGKIAEMHHVLVLGVAGGSVIKTLVDEINYAGTITGVEIDREVIAVANSYFQLDRIPNFEIVIDDAFEFVLKTRKTYDLIVVDVFQDALMPNFLFEHFFANRLGNILNVNGYILFNTMVLNEEHEARNKQYLLEFDLTSYNVKTVPRVESHNELIIIEKIA